MKKVFFSIACSVVSVSFLFAQAEMDAYKYAQTELSGTARSVAMGGAFGALGGDLSVLNSNPGGLGVYKSSEISTTVDFMHTLSKSDLGGFRLNDRKFAFSLDNIGIVWSFDLGKRGSRLNFGFSYNKSFSFNRNYQVSGNNLSSSMLHYISGITNRWRSGGIPENEFSGYDAYYNDVPWLGILAYNTYLMNPSDMSLDPNKAGYYTSILESNEAVSNFAEVNEQGSISEYSFALGGSLLEEHLQLGASFVLSDIDYRLTSFYKENFDLGGGFALNNWFSTEGTGFNMKLGAIIRPINSLRIGIAYHTPTWYVMRDYFDASMVPDKIYDDQGVAVKPFYTPDAVNYTDYHYRTPGKWVVSLAAVLGRRAIVSADWEIVNYRHMNMDYYMSDVVNDYIENDFRTSSTMRVGAEIKITSQLSVRGGAAFRKTPIKTSIKDDLQSGLIDIPTAGTIPNFCIDRGSNTYTFGLGYRFNQHFYLDAACALMRYNADYYNFSPLPAVDNDGMLLEAVGAQVASLKTNRTKVLFTLGYKF